MEFKYRFDSIVILQWLRAPEDDPTGKELASDLQPLCDQAGIRLLFREVSSSAEFLGALETAVFEAVARGGSPIVHIETHGSAEGICATPADVLPWKALVPHLRTLNVHSRMNLLVTMAACHGFNLIKVLPDLEQPCPVWGLVGPDEQVMPSDVRRGFRAFFSTLLAELNLEQALQALKEGDWSWPNSWRIQFAETFFSWVFAEYLKALTVEQLKQREDRIVAQGARDGIVGTPERLAVLRWSFGEYELQFAHMRRTYLMLDAFPENDERFPIRYDDVLRVHKIDHTSLPMARARGAG